MYYPHVSHTNTPIELVAASYEADQADRDMMATWNAPGGTFPQQMADYRAAAENVFESLLFNRK